MRRLLFICFAYLLAQPAWAQDWSEYVNDLFGYQGSIPPGYVGYGESDDGHGQVYEQDSMQDILLLRGANMTEQTFEADVALGMSALEGNGYNISFQTVTPRWATYSGVKDDWYFTRHMILLCNGTSTASFTLHYPKIKAGGMKDIVQRMAQDFRATGC